MVTHAVDASKALKAELFKNLVQGDEVLVSFMEEGVEIKEVAVVWFVNDDAVITNNGHLILLEDAIHLEKTGTNFETFSHVKKAEDKFYNLKKGMYLQKTTGSEPEPE